jgi:hypothetical protein
MHVIVHTNLYKRAAILFDVQVKGLIHPLLDGSVFKGMNIFVGGWTFMNDTQD